MRELRTKTVCIATVETIQVDTYEVGVLQCGFTQYPESPVEAKFSIPYTVAAALVKGKISQAEFTEEVLADERIKALAGKVSVVSDPMFSARYPRRWDCRMTVRLRDGRELVRQNQIPGIKFIFLVISSTLYYNDLDYFA